ncbi:protein of unknown function [Burkholderia multivorans]
MHDTNLCPHMHSQPFHLRSWACIRVLAGKPHMSFFGRVGAEGWVHFAASKDGEARNAVAGRLRVSFRGS